MAFQFEVRRFFVVIVDQPLVAIAEIDRAEVGHQHQAVPGQVEVAVDGLAHHAADVGAAGIHPAFVHLPGYSRAADIVILLKHDDVEPGLGQVGGVGQTVMACADDDGVVVAHRRISCAALCPAHQ